MSQSDYYYFRGMLNELKSHTTKHDTLKTSVEVGQLAGNNTRGNIGDGQTLPAAICLGYDDSNGKMVSIDCDANGHLQVDVLSNSVDTNISSMVTATKATRENQTLAGVSALTVYGSNNGTSIDMDGYRHLVIKVRSSATTGSSPLQNLRLYYSLDDSDFTIGEIVAQNELPGSSGNYQGIVRLENVGFRYIRLFSIGVTASPTAYYVYYSRSN